MNSFLPMMDPTWSLETNISCLTSRSLDKQIKSQLKNRQWKLETVKCEDDIASMLVYYA